MTLFIDVVVFTIWSPDVIETSSVVKPICNVVVSIWTVEVTFVETVRSFDVVVVTLGVDPIRLLVDFTISVSG